MRRLFPLFLLGLGGSTLAAAPAFATQPPAFVVPGRPDVPVIINGVDASWCVVEGDWGLDRPASLSPIVICRTAILPERGGPSGGYYPRLGHPPRAGRLEVRPPANRPLPRPAPTFHRVWSAGSDQLPATEYPPLPVPPIHHSPMASKPAQKTVSTPAQKTVPAPSNTAPSNKVVNSSHK